MPQNQPVIPVVTGDGHRFDLIRVPAEPAREHLLLIPGMGLSARNYIDFAHALAARGVEVWIHEWRGIGSSSLRAARGVDWGYRELLADLAASRAAIAARAREGRYLLGGHSLGGQLLCLSAGADPGGCRGLVLIASGAPFWRAFSGRMRWVMLPVMVGFPLLGRLFGYYPGRRVGFAGNEARGVMSDWGRSARSGKYRPRGVEGDPEAGMAALELPLLAITMARDPFAPRSSRRWLTDKLCGCRKSERIIDARAMDARPDHYTWMKSPRATAQAIVEWLPSGPGRTTE